MVECTWNVTLRLDRYLCKNSLSVKHILFECPITTVISEEEKKKKKKEKKMEMIFNACKNLRVILYNTEVINSIVELIVHSPCFLFCIILML